MRQLKDILRWGVIALLITVCAWGIGSAGAEDAQGEAGEEQASSRPEFERVDGEFECDGYDEKEKAYVLVCEAGTKKVSFKLAGSAETPVSSPSFVLKNWGRSTAELKVDGEKVETGEKHKTNLKYRLDGTDRIVWVKVESEETVEFELAKPE